MKMYHGVRLYAVDSRDIGTFGGHRARATIKIYDGSCANTPRATISGEMVNAVRRDMPTNRLQTEYYLRGFLPSDDPYRV